MIKKRKIKCKFCTSLSTVSRGSRNGLKRYFCSKCHKSFSVDHRKKKTYWVDYADGLSFRKLSLRNGLTPRQICRLTDKELDELIDNSFLSSEFCDHRKWSGIACVDGKYVRVKGYEKKIPFIYCIDYLSHDIVCGLLAPSENMEIFSKLFRLLKTVNYPMKYLVCDNILESLKFPLNFNFPEAKIQLCLTHYAENIRKALEVRSKTKYQEFFTAFQVFLRRRESWRTKREKFKELFSFCSPDDTVLESILISTYQDMDYLFLYLVDERIPKDNNLIESFNSHIEGRLKTIRRFGSFSRAEKFLNGWIVRRRTTIFTSCRGKFTPLNGKSSLEIVLKDEKNLEKTLKSIYRKTIPKG
jgi:Transposase, Mutator family